MEPGASITLIKSIASRIEHRPERTQRAYATEHDASEFFHSRATHEVLPRAKQRILDSMTHMDKREKLDDLVNKIGRFLRADRHVAASGDLAGAFPVDHLDAAFAMGMMQTLLSHLSLMLSAERQRLDA
jgi:hypothetical protein